MLRLAMILLSSIILYMSPTYATSDMLSQNQAPSFDCTQRIYTVKEIAQDRSIWGRRIYSIESNDDLEVSPDIYSFVKQLELPHWNKTVTLHYYLTITTCPEGVFCQITEILPLKYSELSD